MRKSIVSFSLSFIHFPDHIYYAIMPTSVSTFIFSHTYPFPFYQSFILFFADYNASWITVIKQFSDGHCINNRVNNLDFPIPFNVNISIFITSISKFYTMFCLISTPTIKISIFIINI